MGFFSRKKEKDNRENKIDAAFNRVYARINKIDTWDDPKKLEHYILDSCEQIIASTKELARKKTEYKIVTRYLNDIKTLENLPGDMSTELRNTAKKITELEETLLNSKKIKRNITDSQFTMMAEEEDQMPQIINRLADDERYQDKVKHDMNYLEGEKSRWEIEKDSLLEQKNVLHRVSMIVLILFLTILILVFVLMNSYEADLTTLLLIVFFVCAVMGALIFYKQNDIKRKSHVAVIRLNQAISLLNVQRMKYVNVTNGIEFQKDKYSVKSAAELQYVWQQYMDTLRDQETYKKNNQDLQFFDEKLTRLLSKIDLYDKKIWTGQTNALINRSDMADVRHSLVVRRQKIRDLIEENMRIVQNERDEIDRLMIEHQHYWPEIREIIKKVDELCGTSSSHGKEEMQS